MTREILPNVYCIEVPLPRNPLRAVNCYLIRGPERDFLIDTGMARPECRDALHGGLEALSVDYSRLDLFVTHMHADHSGLSPELAARGAVAYCSEEDARVINGTEHWEGILEYAGRSGFPRERLEDAHTKHPGFKYRPQGRVDFVHVAEGDTLRAGDFSFQCVSTPGHTPGHLCLYDAEKRLLVSGDMILDSITPNISLWSDGENPLREYLESLDRIYAMEIDLALPGHRNLITDCRGRIDELRHHHHVRLDEVLSLLGPEPQSAYQVASRMSWDMSYKSWEEFPIPQKWFATGEAVAHLRYLEEEGEAERVSTDGQIFYRRDTR